MKKSAERTFKSIDKEDIKFEINLINRCKTNNYLLEQDKRDFNSIFFTIEFTKNIDHHKRFTFLNEEKLGFMLLEKLFISLKDNKTY